MDEQVPGGAYRSDQNEDGTWNIRDVPIFSECHFPLPKGGEFHFTKEWLDGAISIAATKEREQFLARVHVHHHDDGEGEVIDAGYLRPTHVGNLTVDGKAKATLYADLIRVPPDVYEMVRAGRLPYRSIEAVPQDGFIDSLALMPTKAPFHRLPLLTVGDEAVAGDKNDLSSALDASPRDGALVASFVRNRGHAVVALSEYPMPENLFKTDAAVKAMSDDKPDDDKKESGEDEQVHAEEGSGGVSPVKDALESGAFSIEEVSELIALLQEKLAALQGPAEEAPEEEPIIPEEGPVEMAATEGVKAAVDVEAKLDLALGRIDALET